MQLTFDETRVLGVLIEKSLAQPAYYPMTVNAITNACNQKTNRDPITDLSESQVSRALSMLRTKGLTSQADPERNSRSVKFEHNIDSAFGWNAAQRALMAELLVRGPQTLAELKARASRMTHLESNDYARELLGELERADPPLVVEMEREPGRSARRFKHLLGDIAPEGQAAPPQASSPVVEDTAGSDIAERLSKLEAEVAELRKEIAAMRGKQSPH